MPKILRNLICTLLALARVSSNLMEEESAQVLPEDMLNEELETLAMASIQTLKQSNKNAEKIKFLNWSTIPLRNKFQGRFSKAFYTG